MSQKDIEGAVKSCYSTWGATYYDDYYGPKAAYPPVHRDLIRNLLVEAKVRNVLDAGCGSASFLRELAGLNMGLFGFDLTPEMVQEGSRVFREMGLPAENIWEGSVFDPDAYQPPGRKKKIAYDAAICIGVLPHIPEVMDQAVISNLQRVVRRKGLVIIEARNQLFSLFTMNRYSYQFILEELIRDKVLRKRWAGDMRDLDGAFKEMQVHFRMDLPPVRKGKADEPGYDEVLSRTHNPFVLKQQFVDAGFEEVRLLFYHYHCLPPMFEAKMPEFFARESLAMEDPTDWRGHFMASAFLLAGRRK